MKPNKIDLKIVISEKGHSHTHLTAKMWSSCEMGALNY